MPGFKDIFAIAKIPDDRIDKNKVVRYRVYPKANWLEGLQKLNKKS
jgi:hypothetical protein